MTPFNENANMKQFELVKFINEKSGDDYVMTKISLVLRRDEIEAPYYMNIKIKASSCIDRPESGIIHAMDMINHNRQYNLTESAYNEIKLIIDKLFDENKIIKKDKSLKINLTSKSKSECENLFKNYHELFDKIDIMIKSNKGH